jgi:hypothetical protein
MKIEHTCKFCSAPITLEMDDDGDICFGLDYLKSIAACNRCADYREKRRSLIDRLINHSIEWSRAKTKQLPLGPQEMDKLKEAIISATKKYSDLCCRFKRIQSVWEYDFAQQIMDQPHKTMQILSFYERNLGRFQRT